MRVSRKSLRRVSVAALVCAGGLAALSSMQPGRAPRERVGAAAPSPTRHATPSARATRAASGSAPRVRAAAPAPAAEPRDGSAASIAEMIERTHHAFLETGDALVAGVRSYERRLQRDGSLQLLVRDGDETAELELGPTRIRRGDARLDPVGAPTVDDEGAAVRDGAVIERFENDTRGLEVTWSLATEPAGDGPLSIRIPVHGATQRTVTETGVHLADGTLGVRYGHATLIDAEGARTELPVRLERGMLALDVSASTLDRAAYPVVIDPVIAAEVAVDGPSPGNAMPNTGHTSIAWNGSTYLAVWADGRVGGTGPGIYASRVTSAGTPLDIGGFAVARASNENLDTPSVASNGSGFLVAYRSDGTSGGHAVRAARVTGGGTVLDPSGIVLDTTNVTPGARPLVASDGAAYAVTWSGRFVGVGTDGSVSYAGGVGGYPEFTGFSASGSSSYLGVYTNQQYVVSIRFDASLNFTAFQNQFDFGSSTMKQDASLHCLPAVFECRVVWNAGGTTGSVWTSTLGQPTSVQLVATYGTTPSVLQLGTSTGLITYTTNNRVRAVTLANVFNGTTSFYTEFDAVADSAARLASDGTNYAVAGFETARIGLTTGAAGAATTFPVAIGSSAESFPSVASNGSGALVAWLDARVPVGVYYGRLDASGGALDSVGRLLGTNDGGDYEAPSVATDGTHYAVGWYGTSSFVRRLDGVTGNPLDAGALDAGVGAYVKLASNGSRYLVVGTSFGQVRGRTITSAGALEGGGAIDVASGYAPAVTSNGSEFLVAWENVGDLYASRFSSSGAMLDTGGFVLSAAPNVQSEVALASNGSNYLAVWTDDRAGTVDLYGTRIDASGVVLDPTAFAVSTAPSRQTATTLAFDGREYLAVWEDMRTASTFLYGTRITSAGDVEDASVGTPLLANASMNGTAPALARFGSSYLLAYQRQDYEPPHFGASRVRARVVSYGGRNGSLCTQAADCDSGYCTDGVCCNVACSGGTSDCLACSVSAGAFDDGVCGVVQRSSNTVCRGASDACDAAEVCDGSNTTCPADGLAPSGAVCRGAAGACDVAETCTGTSAACPTDGLLAAGSSCRAAAGPCDVEEVCAGDSAACPVNDVLPSGTTCRASAGTCDVAEVCDGTATACPGDTLLPVGNLCRVANGPCDVAEYCTGQASCPQDGFAGNTTQCDVAHGACDFADYCTGTSASCPELTAPEGTGCDDGFGCTRDDACAAGACVGTRRAAGEVCRGADGACDVEETCDGLSDACPADVVQPVDTVCRASIGACDAPEICDGRSPACPGDVRFPAGTTCRSAAGACDLEEQCTGASASCPADTFKPVGSLCRGATGACDATEYCGGGASCPADEQAADGTPCNDGLACSQASACTGGACLAYLTLDCSDDDPCTTDLCAEPNGCMNTPVPACVADAGVDAGRSDASTETDAGPTVIVIHEGCSCAVAGGPVRGRGGREVAWLGLVGLLVVRGLRRARRDSPSRVGLRAAGSR